MTKEEAEKLYDKYATEALGAMISKIPLIDRDGEMGESKAMSQEELNGIKLEVCNSAHAYAYMMMETRDEVISQLPNIRNLNITE